MLESRYGKFASKDGQQVGWVKRSWEVAISPYPWDTLVSAFRHLTSTSKEFWPSVADFKASLDAVGANVASVRNPYASAPADWQNDWQAFQAWYGSIPLILTDVCQKKDDVLVHFVGAHKGDFAHLCVRAWRMGIPHRWDAAVSDYVAHVGRCHERRAGAMTVLGEYAANTMKADDITSALARRRAA